MKSVQEQCLEEIAGVIRGLALRRLDHSSVHVARLPWYINGDGTAVINRGIYVHPAEEREAPGTNEREDIGYGCAITMIVPATHSGLEEVGLVSEWRETIRRRLVNRRLTDLVLEGGHSCIVKIEHNNLNVPRQAHRYEVSSMVARCWVREPRTS